MYLENEFDDLINLGVCATIEFRIKDEDGENNPGLYAFHGGRFIRLYTLHGLWPDTDVPADSCTQCDIFRAALGELKRLIVEQRTFLIQWPDVFEPLRERHKAVEILFTHLEH